MPEPFADPGSAIARGFEGGFKMVMTAQEMKNQQQAREWEKDIDIAKLSMELGTNKNLPSDTRANALNNGMVPVWNKHQLNGHEIKPFTAADFQDKLLTDTADSVSKIMGDKKLTDRQKYEATTNAWTGYYKQKNNADEASKIQLDMMKHFDTKNRESAPKPPAPDDAFKRQTELVMQMGKLDKGDFNEQMMSAFAQKAGITIQPGQTVTPDMKQLIKTQGRQEFESLNQYLPENQRRYLVTPAEMEKLKSVPGITKEHLSRVLVLP